MAALKFVLVLVLALAISGTFAKSYKGHKVVSFFIENEDQLKEIQTLEGQAGVKKQVKRKP